MEIPFIDAHCHLDRLFHLQGWRRSLGEYRATHPIPFPPGFRGAVSVWCDPPQFHTAPGILADQHELWAAFGVHPLQAPLWSLEVASQIEGYLDQLPQALAWGEMGLDYHGHRGPVDRPHQRAVFRAQLRRAARRDVPVVIHCRDAETDLLQVMKEILPRDYPFHYHCVSVGPKLLTPVLEYFPHAKFGFTGLLSDPRRGGPVRESLRRIPLHRIVAETDAPYFPPSTLSRLPPRWRRSHPGMASEVVTAIATIKKTPLAEVAARLLLNTQAVYGMPLRGPG